MSTTGTTRRILIRDGCDWGEFFVHEQPPTTTSDGYPRYAATWSCVSSFGTFGHCWGYMGEPFAKFAAQVNDDYLLGKISKRVFDPDKFSKWIRREIFTSKASKEAKLEASRRFRELFDDYAHSGHLGAVVYADDVINQVEIRYGDGDNESWDRQAVVFVEKLWPKFVTALQPQVTQAV